MRVHDDRRDVAVRRWHHPCIANHDAQKNAFVAMTQRSKTAAIISASISRACGTFGASRVAMGHREEYLCSW